jgi:glycosyltransferase involved in cell wall biosynthesis
MLFKFLKYINPIWYYLLETKNKTNYFVNFSDLSDSDQIKVELDKHYESKNGSIRDFAFQAWSSGLISTSETSIFDKTNEPTISDNYRFVKKFYHPAWSFFILILRILEFKNPFNEIYCYFTAFKTKRVNLNKAKFEHSDFNNFDSQLLQKNYKVSIIIPTLNRYQYLRDALIDLENQTYKNFEVIVVDQSNPFQEDFYKQFGVEIILIRQEARALWQARNSAVKVSRGELILLFDDDSRVEKDWVEQHIKCLDYFDCEISSGASISVAGGKVPSHYSFFRWGDQIDTGNALLKKSVFREIGLFDLQFNGQRMGDGEFGIRAFLSGFKNVNNPLAMRIHLKVKEGGLREMGSWDAFRPTKLFSPRPIPSVFYLSRRYFGNYSSLLMLIVNVPMSIIPYKYKGNTILITLSMFAILLILPFLLIQVLISWKISSRMISEGPKIEEFKG